MTWTPADSARRNKETREPLSIEGRFNPELRANRKLSALALMGQGPPVPRFRLTGDLGGLVVVFVQGGRIPVVFDNFRGGRRVFFSYQNDGAANTRKRILRRIERLYIRFDASRFEQSLHHDRFCFLLCVENLDELFVGSRSERWGICVGHGILRRDRS